MSNRPAFSRRRFIRLSRWVVPLHFANRSSLLGFQAGDKFQDDFGKPRDTWRVVSGQWHWQSGVLEQTELKREVAILELTRDVAQSFQARTRLRILNGPTYRSAGILFGYRDSNNYAGVYVTSVSTDTEPFGPKVQLFYREQGRYQYPPVRASFDVTNGKWYWLELRVTARRLEVSVDRKPVLDSGLTPLAGNRLALFAFDSHVEFDQFEMTGHNQAG
jgi:hypothetical protein